jgi:hypothetical protein
VGGGAEPRGARLGLAGRTAASTCPAGPLSDPKEGEMRWRGVTPNSDRPEGSTLLPPSPPWWGGRGTWLQGGRVEPTPWVRGRGLLTTRVSSELTGVTYMYITQLLRTNFFFILLLHFWAGRLAPIPNVGNRQHYVF